jgi:hypothetical protein
MTERKRETAHKKMSEEITGNTRKNLRKKGSYFINKKGKR